MEQSRRAALRTVAAGGMFAALATVGLVSPARASARHPAAFDATSLEDALRALGVDVPTHSDHIEIDAPEVAEDGAVVRVAVRSALPGADWIAILIDHNPNPLAAMFSLAPGTVAAVETRVKMAQHSALTVLVRVDGRFHMASRVVQVTVGGCG